jgi:hypothetical protein
MTTITSDLAPALARFEADLDAGRVFHYFAASHESADRMGYYPMPNAGYYARALSTLVAAIDGSDFMAEAVTLAIKSVSPFLNEHQALANIALAFGRFAGQPWEDTRKRTGPEAGRPSGWTHEVTLLQKARLYTLMQRVEAAYRGSTHSGTYGWAIMALAEREGWRL